MAEQAKNAEATGETGLWARLIVIAYALGIVAIGAKPLAHNYDRLWSDMRAFARSVRSHADELRAPSDASVAAKDQRAAPKQADARVGASASSTAADAGNGKAKQLDRITSKDKEELNSLLGKL